MKTSFTENKNYLSKHLEIIESSQNGIVYIFYEKNRSILAKLTTLPPPPRKLKFNFIPVGLRLSVERETKVYTRLKYKQ